MPLSKRYVAVGDSSEVGIGLKISRSARKITKSPRVSTSDPENKDLLIRLEAQVVAAFDSTTPATIHPQRINIPPDRREGEFMLVVRNVSEAPIQPHIVWEEPGVLDLEFPPGFIEPGEEKVVTVKIDDDFDKLAHKTSFTMEMSDPEHTRFTIPVEIGTSGQVTTRPTSPPSKSPRANDADKQVIRPTADNKGKSGGK